MSLTNSFRFLALLLVAALFSGPVFAQENTDDDAAEITTSVRTPSAWSFEVSAWQWNDKLKLRQGVLSDTDFANYNALVATVQREFIVKRWGFGMGAFVGSGSATGGGNSSIIAYQKSRLKFTVFGVTPRIFYRLSGRVNAGMSALVFSRVIDWPADSSLQTIDAGRNLNASILADLNIRLSRSWEFYQGVGPLAEGATLWKLGLIYKF